jgi:hypothetical protein
MSNLKYLSLDIMKPTLDRSIIAQLPRLRNLQGLHVNGLSRFSPDDFQQIVSGCPFLRKMHFPRRVAWAEPSYLNILQNSKIREIRPWSYIGGYEEYKIEGQSYRYMLRVLEALTDLEEIDLHLHIFANGQEEAEEVRKQTELLPRVAELIAKQKCLKSFGLFQAGRNYEEVQNIASFNLANLLQTMPHLESLRLSSMLSTYDDAIIASIYRTIGSLTNLKRLLLDEIPITDSLKEVFSNSNLESLTLRRPSRLLFDNTQDLEDVIARLARLPKLSDLRLVISKELEFEQTTEGSPGLEWKRLSEAFDDRVRTSVVTTLGQLSKQLVRLELNGSWICDKFVCQMPCLPNLEALRLIPSLSRVVLYGEDISLRRLSTVAVLTYAQTCCPIIREPKFLRYHRLLEGK